VFFLAWVTIAWCPQVTVAPELSNKNVLVKGIPLKGTGRIDLGGQTPPMLKTGERLE